MRPICRVPMRSAGCRPARRRSGPRRAADGQCAYRQRAYSKCAKRECADCIHPDYPVAVHAISRHSSRTFTSVSARSCDAFSARIAAGASSASAHTAAPRTSGEASARWPFGNGRQFGVARVADGDQHVPEEPVAADALDRRRRESLPEGRLVERREIGKARRDAIGARLQLRLARRLRELVPRADGEAIVAAVDAVADGLAELARDRALVLDGEIGDAAARIELVRRRKRVGRADVEAGAAGAAGIGLGRVRRQRHPGDDRAEEQPGAEFAADEIGVLALPAEPAACASGFSISGAVSTKTFTSLPVRALKRPASTLSLPLISS